MMRKRVEAKTTLLDLVAKVIEAGATEMEVEYRDGCEEILAVDSLIGVGIARLDSSSEEARSLRADLYAIAKKRRVIHISGCSHVLRVRIVEDFGEDKFLVTIERHSP